MLATRRQLALAILLAISISLGTCCGNKGGSQTPSSDSGGGDSGSGGQSPGAGNIGGGGGGPPPADCSGPLECKMGLTNDDVQGYDPSAYNGNTEPVKDPKELTCDFESPCCWTNDEGDDADWLVGTKSPDEALFQENFGPYDVVPQAKYIFTGGQEQDPEYKAIFKSCEIACTNSDTVVLFDVFQTANPIVEVCTRPLGGGEPENCQTIPKDPGAIGLAELPPMPQGGEIVIVAKNFIAPDGDFVILDRNLEVQAEPCPDEPEPTSTGAAPAGDECAIQCKFQGETCGWKDASTIDKEYLPERYQNGEKTLVAFAPVDQYNPNGVFPSGPVRDGSQYPDDTGFLSGVIDRQEGAGLVYGPINNPEDRILRLEYYCAFTYNQVSICLESIDNCPFESEPAGDFTDTQWKTAEITVPANTQYVIIIGRRKEGEEAEAANLSEVGVANVQWLDASGNPICPTQ